MVWGRIAPEIRLIADDRVTFDTPGRARLLALVALLFVAAQLVFGAHAAAQPDYLLDHSPANCAICIAGAVSDDPALHVVGVAEPVPVLGEAATPMPRAEIATPAIFSAEPRAPPCC